MDIKEIVMDNLAKEIRDVKLKITSLLSKRSSHICLYPGCKEKAILSHSISKSILSLIAKNGKIIEPIFDRNCVKGTFEEALKDNRINLKLKENGLSKASTFKGFCHEHDNSIFTNIDNRGIVTQRDIFLQLYRTACMYFFTYNIISEAEQKNVHGYEYNSNSEFEQKIPISLDKIIFLLNDLLIDFPELDKPISIKPDEIFVTRPFSNKINLNIEIFYKKIDFLCPLALQKDFTVSMDGIFQHSIIVVTPSKESTNLIILCHPSITGQYGKFFQNKIGLLNLIESIIMSDADFYLAPDEFNKWDTQKIKFLEEDYYFFNERKFLQEYDFSLFDELRTELCSDLPESLKAHEMAKISHIPKRKTFKERNNSMSCQTIRDRQKKINFTGNKTGLSYPIGTV